MSQIPNQTDNNFISKEALIIVITTESNLLNAEKLADKILHGKYAACVQFNNVKSSFWWNGAIENAEEIQLLIKTKNNKLEDLISTIKDFHSYENPEIVFWEASASELYLNWLKEAI